MRYLLYIVVCWQTLHQTWGHGGIQGVVYDECSKAPLEGVLVRMVNEENSIAYSDKNGRFYVGSLSAGNYPLEFTILGYRIKTEVVEVKEEEVTLVKVYLQEDVLQLPEVVITSREEFSGTTIHALDFKLRPHSTTQDLLRIVPGLFIAQHAGGGKAEQLFLRGFDIDHGTDVSISVDDMPVNMVSHAHGQGYADLHFVIPETIERLDFSKGPYEAGAGNFNTAGAVRFRTKNYLERNMLKYELGRFNTHRALAMVNLFPSGDSSFHRHNAFLAGEYFFSRLYFDDPQDLNRINVFGKYNGQLSNHTHLSASISSFYSCWNASGQIPQRAVDNGMLSRFGSIDPTEGGSTSRSNANVILTNYLHNSGVFSQQIYYTGYRFDLYSNFTFFLEDSVHGDQIRQTEKRSMFGYNGSYKRTCKIGNNHLTAKTGIGYRGDRIDNSRLSRTEKRMFVRDIRRGDIRENNLYGFLEADLAISHRWNVCAGIRYDYFTFTYRSALEDTVYPTVGKGIVSPKISMYYKLSSDVQWYLKAGYGFHSNDSRVSVMRKDTTSLPKAKSVDVGINCKIHKRILINAALWFMFLESEYTYVGDGGFIEPGNSTRRWGVDLSGRYQMFSWLFADIDLTYSHARFENISEGENYIPLAPSVTATGGVSVKMKNGFSGSVRFRHLGERPASENYSVSASGYFLIDAVLAYQGSRWLFSLTVENVLNQQWKEAQFATESKLKNETHSVTENHFTPGAPLFVKGCIAWMF